MTFHDRAAAADTALEAFIALVRLRDEPGWSDDAAAVAENTGRPVVLTPQDRGQLRWAARRVHDAALVDAIADCLEAGISKTRLNDCRGWLFQNELAGFIARAGRPSVESVRETWPQARALKATRADLTALLDQRRDAEAQALAKSARTFLRRWVITSIPPAAPEEVTARVATSRHAEHRATWIQARADLLKQIRSLPDSVTTSGGTGSSADVSTGTG